MEEFIKNLKKPSEALSLSTNPFKDNFCEDIYPGWRTQSVTGREDLSADITEQSVENGTIKLNSKINSKEIKVKFDIIKDTSDSFNNLLSTIRKDLQQEGLTARFLDDYNRYYNVDFASIEVESFKPTTPKGFIANCILTLKCLDHFKYATTTNLAQFTKGVGNTASVEIKNNGTASCVVDYEINFKTDTGYILINNDKNNKKIEFGYNSEDDTKKDILRFKWQDFLDLPADTRKNYLYPSTKTDGNLILKGRGGYNWLTLGSRKTTTNISFGLRTMDTTKSTNGLINMYTHFRVGVYANEMGESGLLSLTYIDADDKVMFGYEFLKADYIGNTCIFRFHGYGGNPIEQFTFSCDTSTGLYIPSSDIGSLGSMDLRRENDKVTFYTANLVPGATYRTYTISQIKDKKVAKIQIAVGQYDNRSAIPNDFMYQLMISELKVTELNADSWTERTNRFSEGDKLKIDGKSSISYLNGVANVTDEVIGSEYFEIPPNQTTKINLAWSKWSDSSLPPVAYVRYKERYY